MRSLGDRRGIPVFLLIAFGLSSPFYFLIIKSGHIGGGGGLFVATLMWCPAVAAMLTCKYLGRDLSTLGWKWGRTRYEVASYLIPLGYGAVVYSVVWLTRIGGFYNKAFIATVTQMFGLGPLPGWMVITLYSFFAGTVGVVQGCTTALGEEIGWRGFFVPELARGMGFTFAALICGLVWALWHYPIVIFADYNPGTSLWYAVPCFTVGVVALSFISAWLRLKSGSVWTSVILHASHNVFIQNVLDAITANGKRTRYVSGEFGAALPVILVILATYFWTRRGEVSSPPCNVSVASPR